MHRGRARAIAATQQSVPGWMLGVLLAVPAAILAAFALNF